MSDQSTEHATPTVQVKEIGLPEQASVGKVLVVAGVAAGVAAGLIALFREKDDTPTPKTDEAKAYLRDALEEAQKKDFAKIARKERKKATRDIKRGAKKVEKETDALLKQTREKASDSADVARDEFGSFLNMLKGGGKELERLAEDFAESGLMNKLREFGEEARVIAEQGKEKSAKVAHKAQSDYLPQAAEAARQATEVGKEKIAEVADKAKSDFVPAAQKVSADVQAQAKDLADHVGKDAERLLSDASHTASEKGKQASTAAKRGGRETRSLLLWLSLAGILIFTVFLDEDQQKKLKEIAVEVFGEARDMYGDMKGGAAQ